MEKNANVERLLAEGWVVCIQETHFTPAQAAVWKLDLLTREVFLSCTDDDPPEHGDLSCDDRRGGVATALPVGCKLDLPRCRILVPGHAILTVHADEAGAVHRIINVYLRSGAPGRTWALVADAVQHAVIQDPDAVIAGDFNVDLARLGTSSGAEDPPEIPIPGLAVIAPDQPTCRRGGTHRTFDGALVPSVAASRWDVQARWAGVSDHAQVRLSRRPAPPESSGAG